MMTAERLKAISPGLSESQLVECLGALGLAGSASVSRKRFAKVINYILSQVTDELIIKTMKIVVAKHITDGDEKGKIPLSGIGAMLPTVSMLHYTIHSGMVGCPDSTTFNTPNALVEVLRFGFRV